MEIEQDQAKSGATATFDYDRMTVERFREAFPRARWDDAAKAWVVPGKTAQRRVDRWQALEAARADVHADARGRDAFSFEPIDSAYLEAQTDLVVRTPYSRTGVEELRQVPFARWDDTDRSWRIPYRSLDALRRRWPAIEAAARRNEPEERARRRAEASQSDTIQVSQSRSRERRRRRFPVRADDPPPFDRPVATACYGIIVVTGTMGELADPETLSRFYSGSVGAGDLIWSAWRQPDLQELVRTWPARNEPSTAERVRGWWLPTKAELVEARKAARSRERRRRTKAE